MPRMISARLDQVATACMRSRAISGIVRGALATWFPATRLLSGTQVANAPRTAPLAVPYMHLHTALGAWRFRDHFCQNFWLLTLRKFNTFPGEFIPRRMFFIVLADTNRQ